MKVQLTFTLELENGRRDTITRTIDEQLPLIGPHWAQVESFLMEVRRMYALNDDGSLKLEGK